MGNYESKVDGEWQFVGREEDLQSARKSLSKGKSLLIFGMPKIGKTRFVSELIDTLADSEDYNDTNILWKDFNLDTAESQRDQYNWFLDLLSCIGAENEKQQFENEYSKKKIECGSCVKCEAGKGQCDKHDELIKRANKTLIKELQKCKSKIILFLDNVDLLMESSLRDNFLTFLRESVKCKMLQIVTASADKPKLTSKNIESLELKKLGIDEILKLLFITTERDDIEDDDEDVTVTYAPDMKVFKPDYKPHFKAIAKLCEGLPLAATMSGSLLKEDDGLLTPPDLVEILICIRLKSLSPDNYPPEDRLDIYKKPMENMKDVETFFNRLNESMDGDTFSIDEAVAAAVAADDKTATQAMVKLKYIKKGLDKSILSMASLPKEQRVRWHGIFRECQAALNAIDDIQSDEGARDMVLKFMKENVRRADLDFDDEILSDPKLLEKAIRCMSLSQRFRAPAVQHQESEEQRDKDEQMGLLDEHQKATEKLTAYSTNDERGIKSLPVFQDLVEIGSSKDFQTPPHAEAGTEIGKKVETRYLPIQGSDSTGYGDINLELVNVRKDETGGLPEERTEQILYNRRLDASPPPPYTTLPESGQDFNNQISGSESEPQLFVNGHGVPIVGEPPPRYSSQHMPVQYHFQTFKNDLTVPKRTRSAQSVCFPTNFVINSDGATNGNTYQWTSRSPDCIYNYNLRRVHSAPCNCVCILESKPDRELDSCADKSLMGPPALDYIPPQMPTSQVRIISSPFKHHHNGEAPENSKTHKLEDLKIQLPDSSKIQLPFSATDAKIGNKSFDYSFNSAFEPAANLPNSDNSEMNDLNKMCQKVANFPNSDNSEMNDLNKMSQTAAKLPNSDYSEMKDLNKRSQTAAEKVQRTTFDATELQFPGQSVGGSSLKSVDKSVANTKANTKAPTAIVSPFSSLSYTSEGHKENSTSAETVHLTEANNALSSKVFQKQIQSNGYRQFKKDDDKC